MKKIQKWGIVSFLMLFMLAGPAYSEEFFGVDIHGFASQGYIQTNDNSFLTKNTDDGSFEFNEVGLNFQKELLDNLSIRIQLFARDLGTQGNNDVVIDWALADYRWNDKLGLRVGKIKMPLGLFNQSRDVDAVRTSILLPQSLYSEPTREVMAALEGISLYGYLDFNKAGSLEYELYGGSNSVDGNAPFIVDPFYSITNGATKGITTATGLEAFAIPVAQAFDLQYVWGGMLTYNTPLDGLKVALTYQELKGDFAGEFNIVINAPNPLDPSGSSSISSVSNSTFTSEVAWRYWMASIQYTWNNLTVNAEYGRRLWFFNTAGATSHSSDEGWYIMVNYRFTDWFELGAYYTQFIADLDDKDGDNLKAAGGNDFEAWQNDFTVTAKFDINEYWVVKGEVHFINGVALLNDISMKKKFLHI